MYYEKKYNETLAKMREWKKKYVDSNILSTDGTIIKDLYDIFPELKESDDERIRKMLIERVRTAEELNEGLREWIIAYLEKQKEQKSIEDVVKDITKDKETATKFLKSAGIMDDNGELAEMYRSEQKPADWPNLSNCIKNCKKCQGKCFYRKEMYQEQENISVGDDDKLYIEDILSLLNFGCSTHSRNEIDMWIKSLLERLNPKPAEWNDEDEKIWQDIFELCNRFGYDDACRLLKSLHLQQKQEWSEEDEEMIARICANLEYLIKEAGCDFILKGKLEERIKWMQRLKSLRPQPYWKPSEEQMYILNWVANILLNHDSIVEEAAAKKLQSLYNDLKKL